MNKYQLVKELLKTFNLEHQYIKVLPFVAIMSETQIKEKVEKVKEIINKFENGL